MSSAISTLTRIYTERTVQPTRSDMPVVGVTSNTAPWELLRAAGFHPVLLSPRRAGTPLADRYMEDVFTARMKAIFDFLISTESACLSAVVIPRTSDQEHKLYLYLREVLRQRRGASAGGDPLQSAAREVAGSRGLRTGTNSRAAGRTGTINRPSRRTRGALGSDRRRERRPPGNPRPVASKEKGPRRGFPARKRWR